MHWLFIGIFLLLNTGCEAQMQKWQRARTVEHLSRLKSYQGHVKWKVSDELAEADIWFQNPNQFLVNAKSGEVLRRDGSTMDLYDPQTRLHSVFKNLPTVTNEDAQQLIGDLFDQSMKIFKFTLGPIDKVAGLAVVELRANPKGESIIQSSETQIFDEFSFPLKSSVKYKNGQSAQYEFSKIKFNENFDLPQSKFPDDAIKIVWDFKDTTTADTPDKSAPINLKLEKSLKHPLGMLLRYYRNGAQFLSVVQYKNLGLTPKRGVPLKVGKHDGFLFPGPISNVLTVSIGDTTTIYSSNLLPDDLVNTASRF